MRGACLGLLVLCASLWAVSYFYTAYVFHKGNCEVFVNVVSGRLEVDGRTPIAYRGFFHPPGWSTDYGAYDLAPPFELHLLDGDILGFRAEWVPGQLMVTLPLWCPTALLGLLAWIAWRQTSRGKTVRGFPVEPLASRQEIAGG